MDITPGVEERVVGLDACPTCHSTHVQAVGPELSETRRQTSVRYRCRSCPAVWLAVYRFVSVEPITLVAKEVINGPTPDRV